MLDLHAGEKRNERVHAEGNDRFAIERGQQLCLLSLDAPGLGEFRRVACNRVDLVNCESAFEALAVPI